MATSTIDTTRMNKVDWCQGVGLCFTIGFDEIVMAEIRESLSRVGRPIYHETIMVDIRQPWDESRVHSKLQSLAEKLCLSGELLLVLSSDRRAEKTEK